MIHELKIRAELICEFNSFQEWVNKASSRLGGYNKNYHVLLCLDKEGYACKMGADMQAAKDNDRFPVKAYFITRSFEDNNSAKNTDNS